MPYLAQPSLVKSNLAHPAQTKKNLLSVSITTILATLSTTLVLSGQSAMAQLNIQQNNGQQQTYNQSNKTRTVFERRYNPETQTYELVKVPASSSSANTSNSYSYLDNSNQSNSTTHNNTNTSDNNSRYDSSSYNNSIVSKPSNTQKTYVRYDNGYGNSDNSFSSPDVSVNTYEPYQPTQSHDTHTNTSNNVNTSNNQSYNSYGSYTQPAVSSGYADTYSFDGARQAARRGDTSALYNYEQSMQGGLFAMYPEYWRLDSDINSLHPSTVTGFAHKYKNSVMAEKLTADYVETKAKSNDYSSIQQVANLVQNADTSEACAIAIGDVHGRNSQRLSEQKDKVWLNTLKQPVLCDQLALEMANHSVVTDKDRQNRMYRMLREGKTGDIMNLASKLGVFIDYSDLQQIQRSPTRFIRNMTNQGYSQKNQYLYLYAIGRLAKTSYREAAMQLEHDIQGDNQRYQHLLADDTRKMAYRTIGVRRMNMNTDDGFNQEALEWFRTSVGLPFNFEEAEDYAMISIRFSQWSDVIKAIDSMSYEHKNKPQWQYWLARAYEETGDSRKAKSLYKKVAKNNDYYGFLSQDRLGKRVSMASLGGARLANISSRQHSKMLKNPHFARAFSLVDVSKKYARREWNWAVHKAIKNGEKDMLLAAARHAHDMGWYDRSIYALEKGKETFGTLNAATSHPMPHQNTVVRYSQRVGIDPAWAYGIMRQESRFNIGAKSGVGASGLMQVMPATGKYIARQLGESYSSRRANSGDTNIRYGTWYMSDILGKLGGQPVLATAGYNAGPSKARRWQPDFGNLPADQYVETIAYPETRNYVKHVMENATIYGNLLGNPMSISERMGTIPPNY